MDAPGHRGGGCNKIKIEIKIKKGGAVCRYVGGEDYTELAQGIK